MAFIKNTERQSLIKKINKSYAFKKFLLLIEILALIGFIVVTFISWLQGWEWFSKDGDKITLTNLGVGMLAYAIIIAILGIVSVILVFTIKSPKNVIKTNKKLESSALSGKRVYKSQTAGDVMRSRTTMKKKK
ncbi:MAG: hypothetical protein ACOQNV_02965 [Mycoplasmoidaceae bacterium]